MILTKLELENFKSFKSSAEVEISPKATIIIGKNGSGKSNLIHAIKLVICCTKLTKEERLDLLHEQKDCEASIALYIDNSDLRLPTTKTLTIKRVISVEKDDYFINGKLTSRKEVQGFLENGGISSLPYFIVQQGKISELVNMTDKSRYELIKNISGVSNYESEKENCLNKLKEAEITKKKYTNNLKIINDKLRHLETEQTKLQNLNNLEKEKRRLEIAYMQKELSIINSKLEECTESYEGDVEEEIKKIENMINNLEKGKMEVDMYCSKHREKLENRLARVDTSITKISREIINQAELCKKYKLEEKEVFIEKTYLKNVINFLQEDNKKDNVEDCKALLLEKQKFLEENKPTGDIFNFSVLDKMIEKRKELWRDEKKLLSNQNAITENMQNNENRLVMYNYKLYKDIQNEKGVLGCVFDLFDIPDEYLSAFEAVAGSFLFNIVVEDDKFIPDLIKKVNGGTFIPLNKMTDDEPMEIMGIELLSSYIETNYKSLLNFVTKNSYVVSDLQEGAKLSSRYNINVVTKEGDLIKKNGILTGGYDSKSSVIKEYKKIQNLKNEISDKLLKIKQKLAKLNLEIETIEKIQKQNDGSFNEFDLIRSICKFLEEKIKILSGKGNSKIFYENKLENATYKLMNIKSELMKLDIDDLKKEKEDLEVEKNKLERFIKQRNDYSQIENLKNKLGTLKNKTDLKKDALISKKQALEEKIGVSDINIDLNMNEIANKLKSVNDELKKYVFLNRRNLDHLKEILEQKNDLSKRSEELDKNYKEILKFIENLDKVKDEKMNLTFEGVKTNFQYFSQILCNFPVELKLSNDSLLIEVNNGNKSLSGGQKTMVALALIFSIQKVDPSPFYIFDEVDANLDEEGRLKLANLFSVLDLQFIITTFREELLKVGSKFVGVSFSEKKSYVSEVDKEVASNFIIN